MSTEDMQYFEHRFESYHGGDQQWPHNQKDYKANPKSLSEAGFYYDPVPSVSKKDKSDRVSCYLCKAAISNWEKEDEPIDRHAEAWNECPLVVIQVGIGGPRQMQSARRQTFANWWPKGLKDSGLTPAKLAAAGMIYFPKPGREDNTRCLTCNMDFYSWEAGDDPAELHKKNSPDCEFVSNLIKK